MRENFPVYIGFLSVFYFTVSVDLNGFHLKKLKIFNMISDLERERIFSGEQLRQ